MALPEDRIYRKDSPEVDAALRYVLEKNGVIYVHERGGRYFFEKQNPRTKKYEKYEIPKERLETLRTRFSRNEPPQDFEGLVYPTKRKPRPQRKRHRK